MKKVLFISTYPFPLNMGSRQHAYYFLKSLVPHYQVYGLFFIPSHEKAPSNANADFAGLGLTGYDICHFAKPRFGGNGYAKRFRSLAAFPNSYINLATNSTGLRIINACIQQSGIDIVHFEHFWYTRYAFKIRADLKKVIVYHDLHHAIFKKLARLESRLHKKLLFLIEAIKFYIYESLLERKATLKVFLNPVEMLAFPNNAIHIPHIVNADIRYRPARQTDFFNLLFVGAYNHPPNRRSVAYIVQSVLPQLCGAHQNFKIHVVGPGTEKFSALVNSSPHCAHVMIHGFKPDINAVFKQMDIALFPILDGGGIKTKLIDALAAGVPVVTTSEGVDGLEGLPEDCIGIGNTPDAIIQEIERLMANYPLRAERSRRGRKFIEHKHSYSAFSHQVAQAYSSLF